MKKIILSTALLFAIASQTMVSCKKHDKSDPPVTPVPTMTDSRDGKVYKIVTIGTQTWMAENLNYQGSPLVAGTFSCYDSLSSNCTTYGTLYNYNAALIASPTGWHLPTDAEWKTLEQYLGMSASDANVNDSFRGAGTGVEVGTKVKEGGSSGLNMKLGGFWQSTYNYHGYTSANLGGIFWTATSGIAPADTAAYVRIIVSTETGVYRGLSNKTGQNSIRCVKD